ncbi:MinD/ParA family ATP-binding protein [Halorientalis halophila]|uniref:MinD/ParA family ATP-binding protein n=1 Tax=Halorientalis halophila TaxID=3108499 RepID=UPI00300A52BC
MGGVYAVAGGKGGVGKTTTAINLGVVLGRTAEQAVVVDADLAMPDVGRRLNLDRERGLHGVLAGETPVRDAVVDGPAGLSVIPGERDLTAFADADPARLRKVLDLLSVAYDVVLVDTGPGLQDETVIAYQEADGVVPVATPESGAVADANRTAGLAADVGAEPIGTVLTHGEGREAREAAERLGDYLLAVVPPHETGGPVAAVSPDHAAAEAYRTVAAALPAVDGATIAPRDERPLDPEAVADAIVDAEADRDGSDDEDGEAADADGTVAS